MFCCLDGLAIRKSHQYLLHSFRSQTKTTTTTMYRLDTRKKKKLENGLPFPNNINIHFLTILPLPRPISELQRHQSSFPAKEDEACKRPSHQNQQARRKNNPGKFIFLFNSEVLDLVLFCPPLLFCPVSRLFFVLFYDYSIFNQTVFVFFCSSTEPRWRYHRLRASAQAARLRSPQIKGTEAAGN